MTATTLHLSSGWSRWFARCEPCGWKRNGRSKEGAQHLVAYHNRTQHPGEPVPEVDPA